MSTQNKISAALGVAGWFGASLSDGPVTIAEQMARCGSAFQSTRRRSGNRSRARIKAHTQPDGEVIEMALCEAGRLMLRPNVLYRFTVRDGCKACADAAAPYSPNAADQQRVPESP